MFAAEVGSLQLKTVSQQMDYIGEYEKGVEGSVYLYGKLLVQNHLVDKAEKACLDMLKSEPSRVNSLLCLSDIYKLRGNREGAMALLKQASLIDPKYDTTHYKMIKLFIEIGEWKEAAKIFEQKHPIFSQKSDEFWLTKAELRIEAGELEEANRAIDYSIRLIDSPTHTPFVLKILIALKRGDRNQVEENLALAIQHTSFRQPKISEKLNEIKNTPYLTEDQIEQAIKCVLSFDISAII